MEAHESISGGQPDDEEEDELDRLTREFEAQASQDLRRAAQRRAAETAPRPKSQKSMAEVREEGLQAPLPEQSKGFRMLAQMGYQKGKGLGKQLQGAAEPISLQLRDRKQGLGLAEERSRKRQLAEQAQAAREAKRQRATADMQHGFAAQQSARQADRQWEAQLVSARQAIETLDQRRGFERSFLWPPEPPPPEAAEAEAGAGEPAAAAAQAAEPSWEDQPAKDRLVAALTYLRTHHCYCLHCGCQYGSPEELWESCPGLMEDDH